jgi:drug/metabolite transporter (DMT)-like permease
VIVAVILSAALHATWNFLLRRAGGSSTVAAMGIIAEALFLLPPAALILYSSGGIPVAQFLFAIVVAAALALANYAALIAAYHRADLSLVYPVARGGVFLFLPLLGFMVFGERLDAVGWMAVAMIVVGIAMLPLARFDGPSLRDLGRHLRDKAMIFALIAAAATAGYTVWDKYAIGYLDTFLYFAGYTILLGAWFVADLLRRPRAEVRVAWRVHSVTIALMGVLIAASYLLVLYALRTGMTTQVLAVRQLSIPIGVLLGWQFLSESLSAPRALGAALVTGGCMLAALL